MNKLSGINVLAVHAHPDDEAIWTGGVLADLAQRGANVTVVTCTLGEEGEVIGDRYQFLTSKNADQLGGLRAKELQDSLNILGARGVFLGGAGCWRDSGMTGSVAQDHPRAFVNSGDLAVDQLKEIMKFSNPHLIFTYGPNGGYGHPDHIRAHQITHQAVDELALATPVLWAVTDRRRLEEGLAVIDATGAPGWRMPQEDEIASESEYDIEVRLSDAALAAKVQAMKAHPTQLWLADGYITDTNPIAAFATSVDREKAPFVFALSNLLAQPVLRYEHYQLGTAMSADARTNIAVIVAGELEAPKEN
jgi:hypothetical protein